MSEDMRNLSSTRSEIRETDPEYTGNDPLIKDYAIASSINGIAIGGLDGVVTYINNAALKMWGSDDPSEIIGKSATVFAQSEQEALEIMSTVLEKGEWTGEISGWRKNGSPSPCS